MELSRQSLFILSKVCIYTYLCMYMCILCRLILKFSFRRAYGGLYLLLLLLLLLFTAKGVKHKAVVISGKMHKLKKEWVVEFVQMWGTNVNSTLNLFHKWLQTQTFPWMLNLNVECCIYMYVYIRRKCVGINFERPQTFDFLVSFWHFWTIWFSFVDFKF